MMKGVEWRAEGKSEGEEGKAVKEMFFRSLSRSVPSPPTNNEQDHVVGDKKDAFQSSCQQVEEEEEKEEEEETKVPNICARNHV